VYSPVLGQQEQWSISGEISTEKKSGTIYIYLIDEAHFDVPGTGVDIISIEVNSARVHYEFQDLDPGVFALRCFQDMNGNKKLDRGLFGPKEPWALTWRNEKRFPPRFEDISFDLTKDLTIDLKLEK
jgi:uncharacterized protein (DUF2141 family)